MHEYSIVASLVERVEREQAAHPGAIVRRLHVRIGELAGVETELLRTAFETFRARSVCEAAELSIVSIAPAWRCARCDVEVPADGPPRCPRCGRGARLIAGDEIVLQRIELEVPDV